MKKDELNELSVLVGKNIASLRKDLGISQKGLAEKLNIAQDSMLRIEKGMIAPKMSRLQDIADVLQCSVPLLFKSETNESIEEYALYIAENIIKLSAEDKKYMTQLIDSTMQYIKSKSLK